MNHQKVLLHNNIAEWLSGADGGTTKVQSVLLQFTQILSNAEKQNLFNANIQIKEYIAENTYSAWILPNAQLDAAKGLLAIGRFSATLKINPAIAQKAKSSQQITLFASFYPELSRQEISAICTQYGASILQNNWEKKGIFKLNIASKQLLVFADDYRVRYISEPTHNIPLDMDSKGAQAASILNMPKPLLGEGLNGNGTVIGIGDNTSGVYHIDQADRIINYNVGDKS
ncbi:MAG: hypothetical protein IT256_04620, partial [Chitinophagaceae bacterium]|nr:hypothetical protein [Chitinophagaceae bacterium]